MQMKFENFNFGHLQAQFGPKNQMASFFMKIDALNN